MPYSSTESIDWFAIQDIGEKLRHLPHALTEGLNRTQVTRDFVLGRDVRVVPTAALPAKPGLASREGQARLLHDLASIELQAMELAVRTLNEFPEAPRDFRQELAEIAASEGEHLKLCLRALDSLGFRWGHWDVHLGLWNTVGREDTLLDRILIVHRYLEGSGLDAGDSILRRLTGVGDKAVGEAVKVIVTEEVGHVLFGSVWFRRVAEAERLDPEKEFRERIGAICRLAPRRERLAREARRLAGFTETEMDELERHFPPLKARGEKRP